MVTKYLFILQALSGLQLVIGSGSLEHGKGLIDDLEAEYSALQSDPSLVVSLPIQHLEGSEFVALPLGDGDQFMMTGEWERI